MKPKFNPGDVVIYTGDNRTYLYIHKIEGNDYRTQFCYADGKLRKDMAIDRYDFEWSHKNFALVKSGKKTNHFPSWF